MPRCQGAVLTSCPAGEDGTPKDESCSIACVPAPEPHCGTWAPANLANADLDGLLPLATAPLAFDPGRSYSIDTDALAITDESGASVDLEGVVFVALENDVALLAVSSLFIPAGATLAGHGRRALAVVARTEIELNGTVDFAAGCEIGSEGFTTRCGGPGGGNGGHVSLLASGCAPGSTGAFDGGGGGGGLGTRGGNGGPGATEAPATDPLQCGASLESPLRGGSGGGAGSRFGYADGGGGGGAIQLTALERLRIVGTVATPALIFVGGGGGGGSKGYHGGGGGGSGGAVLLEGARVEFEYAAVIATGGAGGGGRDGSPGGDARRDGAMAIGGVGIGGGDGGNGAVTASPAESGAAGGGTSTQGGGGGGGGLGRIRIDTPAGDFVMPVNSVAQGVTTVGFFGVR